MAESNLQNAEVVGGAVVKIGADLSELRAGEGTAKGIATNVGKMTATVGATLNLQQLQSSVSHANQIVASGIKQITSNGAQATITPRFDLKEQAIRNEMAKLINSMRAQAQNANITIEAKTRLFGLPGDPKAKTTDLLAGASAADKIEGKRRSWLSAPAASDDEPYDGAGGPGSGSGGRGGLGRGRNLFSLREIGALNPLGVTGAFAVAEAMNVSGGLIDANRIQNDPKRILEQSYRPGALHDIRQDSVMQSSAKQVAAIQADQRRIETFESIPLVGSVFIKLLDSIGGKSYALSRKLDQAQKDIESHTVAVEAVDRLTAVLTERTGRPNASGLLAANREVQIAEREVRNENLYNYAKHDRLNLARTVQGQEEQIAGNERVNRSNSFDLRGSSLFLSTAAAGGRGRQDTAGEFEASRAAARKDLVDQLDTARSKMLVGTEQRVKQFALDQRELQKFDAETNADRKKILRDQSASINTNTAGAISAGLRTKQDSFAASMVDLRAANRNAVAQAPAAEKESLRTRQAAEENEKIVEHERQLGADRDRLAAQASSDQLQIEHRGFDAEMVLLRAENDAKLKLADSSMKASVEAANKASEELAKVREAERIKVATISDAGREAAARFNAALDPMQARLRQFDADAQSELTTARETDRARIAQRQATERAAIVSEQQFSISESKKDLAARVDASQKFIAGHREEAAAIGQIRSAINEVEHATPELREATKAAVTAELEALRSGLTGGHGGIAVAASGDLGEAQAQILESRARGKETLAIRRDITAGEGQIAAWKGPANIQPKPGPFGPLGGQAAIEAPVPMSQRTGYGPFGASQTPSQSQNALVALLSELVDVLKVGGARVAQTLPRY